MEIISIVNIILNNYNIQSILARMSVIQKDAADEHVIDEAMKISHLVMAK